MIIEAAEPGSFAYMFESMSNHSRPYGRMEVHQSVGRRRRWSVEDKSRIVAASFAPGANVSEVARQNDISPQHLFQWRHAARTGQLVLSLDDDMAFAPVMLEPPRGRGLAVEIAGAVIQVTGETDLGLLGAVVRALKAQA